MRTNMNICKPSEKRHRIHGWTFKRFRVCGVLRSSVSHIKWLQGDGTFIGIQGTSFPCIQSPEAMIPAASHHKRGVRPHLHTMSPQGQTSLLNNLKKNTEQTKWTQNQPQNHCPLVVVMKHPGQNRLACAPLVPAVETENPLDA